MAPVSGSVPSLVNGVSQQAFWLRLPSQASAQENFLSSLVDGLTKRAPTQHVARLNGGVAIPAAHMHWVDRDESRRFLVTITNGDLKVYDTATGTEPAVSFPDGKAYLNSAAPETSFVCTSVADYTFVVNKGVTAALTAAPSAGNNWGTIYVKQATYNTVYGVYIDGTLRASHTTAATGNAPRTEEIAEALRSALVTWGGAAWTIERFQSTIRVRRNDNAAFRLTAADSQGDTVLVAYTDKAQSYNDLPYRNFDSMWVEIVGAPDNSADSYYVEYDADEEVWAEVARPVDRRGPDPATMPHVLIRNTDGSWVFRRETWALRGAGDATTAPDPSFIGRTIADVLFYKNRLVLLTDDNIVMSAIGDNGHKRFYPATVVAQLDTDPIDFGISSTKVAALQAGVPFDKGLVLFSPTTQFSVQADGPLSAKTIAVDPVTEFAADLRAKPVFAGKAVFFATRSETSAGVREFLIQPDTQVPDAPDSTIHVPSYLAGQIRAMVASTNENMLFVLTTGEQNALGVYKWYYEGNEKLQSSWSKWTWPTGETIRSISVMGSALFLVIQRNGEDFLERLALDPKRVDAGLAFDVRLDRKTLVTGAYNSGTDETTWTVPYACVSWDPTIVRGAAFGSSAGFFVPGVVRVSNTQFRAPGNFSAGACILGRRYTASYVPTPPTVGEPGPQGRGRRAITDGELKLLTMSLNYANTGAFRVVVSAPGKASYTYDLPQLLVNGIGSLVGQVRLPTGRFRFPVMERATEAAITISSDSHFPCSIQSLDWEASFVMRSRRT